MNKTRADLSVSLLCSALCQSDGDLCNLLLADRGGGLENYLDKWVCSYIQVSPSKSPYHLFHPPTPHVLCANLFLWDGTPLCLYLISLVRPFTFTCSFLPSQISLLRCILLLDFHRWIQRRSPSRADSDPQDPS